MKKGQYKEVLPDRIKFVLSKTDLEDNKISSLLADFTLCEKLNNYIKSSDSDQRIKSVVLSAYQNLYNNLYQTFQYVFTLLIDEIQSKYDAFGRDDIRLVERNEINSYLEKIKRISLIFSDNGMKGDFESEDDLDFFCTWLKGRLPQDLEQQVLREIVERQSSNSEEISENSEN